MDLTPAEALQEAARRIDRGEAFALITIVKASGSTPRKEGARMLVSADRSISGTIGGAAVERIAIDHALEAIRTRDASRLELNLNDQESTETGMICGGSVELLIEPFGREARLFLFGAGHVAEPTARLARELGFRVIVLDERPEWATVERFPGCEVRVDRLEELAESIQPTQDDFIAIMTHCHADDYRVVTRVIGKPCRYLGLIGSRKKSVEIRQRLAGERFSSEQISRLTCPIGLEIGSHTPMEIAVAIAGQIVKVRNG